MDRATSTGVQPIWVALDSARHPTDYQDSIALAGQHKFFGNAIETHSVATTIIASNLGYDYLSGSGNRRVNDTHMPCTTNYNEQKEELLCSIAEEKENLSHSFSPDLSFSLELSILNDLEQFVQDSPKNAYNDDDAFWEEFFKPQPPPSLAKQPILNITSAYDLSASEELPLEQKFAFIRNLLQELALRSAESPISIALSYLDDLERTIKTQQNNVNTTSMTKMSAAMPIPQPPGPPPMLCADNKIKTIKNRQPLVPIPPGEAPRLKINRTQTHSSSLLEEIEAKGQEKTKIRAMEETRENSGPEEIPLQTKLAHFKSYIESLITRYINLPIFPAWLKKFSRGIESHLEKTNGPTSMDDLSESRLFHEETASKIISIINEHFNDPEAQTGLRIVLQDCLQKFKEISMAQNKQNKEAVKAFASQRGHGKAAGPEIDFDTRKQTWLSNLPHKQFKKGLPEKERVQLLLALKLCAPEFNTRYLNISTAEDLVKPISDFIAFHAKVKKTVDHEGLNELNLDYQFWSTHFVSKLSQRSTKEIKTL